MRVHDPVAMERFDQEYGSMGTILCSTPEGVAEEADALVLVTEWQDYRELDWDALASRMKSRIVLDGRNALDRARLERQGFRYVTLAG